MAKDLLFSRRPLIDYWAKLKTDPDELWTARKLWLGATELIAQPILDAWSNLPSSAMPAAEPVKGFDDLTFALAWWCDQSGFGIDPTPLTDCLRYVQQLQIESWYENTPKALDEMCDARNRAEPVLYRMCFAFTVERGLDAPEPYTEHPIVTRFKPPACEKCGAKMRTYKTDKGNEFTHRYLKCTNSACNARAKKSQRHETAGI